MSWEQILKIIRCSFGDEVADAAKRRIVSGQADDLSFLGLIHLAPCEEQQGLDELADLRTSSRIEIVEDDSEDED